MYADKFSDLRVIRNRTKNEPSKNEPPKNEPSKNEPSKNEASKNEAFNIGQYNISVNVCRHKFNTLSNLDFFLITTKEIKSLLSDTHPFAACEPCPTTFRSWSLRLLYNYIKTHSVLNFPNYDEEIYRRECLYYKLTDRKKEILDSVLHFNPNTLKQELSYLSKYTKADLYRELYDIELKLFVLKGRSPKKLILGTFEVPSQLTVGNFTNIRLTIKDYYMMDMSWLNISEEECRLYHRLYHPKFKELLACQQLVVKNVKSNLLKHGIPSDMCKSKHLSMLTAEEVKRIKKYSDYSLYIQWIDNTLAIDNRPFYDVVCEDFVAFVSHHEYIVNK